MSTPSQPYRKPRPIIPPKLHHATFLTLKLAEMVVWYEKVAGLTPVHYSEGAAWLTNDEANHRIALIAHPAIKRPVDKPTSAGLHHTAFEYGDFNVWVDNYQRLKEEGIVPFMCLDHGITMSMYYADPEGNGVEIQVAVDDPPRMAPLEHRAQMQQRQRKPPTPRRAHTWVDQQHGRRAVDWLGLPLGHAVGLPRPNRWRRLIRFVDIEARILVDGSETRVRKAGGFSTAGPATARRSTTNLSKTSGRAPPAPAIAHA